MLNASRQVGEVIGVALLGSLIGADSSFLEGRRLSLVVAGGGLFLGCALLLLFVERPALSGGVGQSRPKPKVVKRGTGEAQESATPGATEEDGK